MENLQFLIWIFLISRVSGVKESQNCGLPVPGAKIVGGVDSGGYHYPWFALLLLKNNSYIPVPVCGGSLITRTYVLTAAHCFTISPSTPNKDLFIVALGVYDICNDAEATREIFNVENVIVHEMYQRTQKFYDLALIKLDKPADYTVICLPLSGVADITESALLIGFGVTYEESNSSPCHMMEVNVTKFSRADSLNTKLPLEDKNEPSVICAGELMGNADSCYGDSGGPLQTTTPDGRYVIAGIVSYGYGCGTPEIPGIYTNVGSYIDWIKNKISDFDSSQSKNRVRSNRTKLLIQRRFGKPKRQHTSVTFPEAHNFTKTKQSSERQTNNNASWFGTNRTRNKERDFDKTNYNFKISGKLPKNTKVNFPN